MSPNNYSITETETSTTSEKNSYERSHSEMAVLNRKNKNILNSFESAKDINGNIVETKQEEDKEYKIEPAWFNIFGFIYLHFSLIQSSYIVHWNKTLAFAAFIGLCTGLGITAGAHRLWAHGAYKANRKLKLLLLMFQTIAFQNSVIEWVRDHRVHHKFTDSNADPHNASRGFFFSHIGWLMCKKHPDVKKYGAKVNMSDLESDPILMFQHKYFLILMPIFCFVLPSVIPWYFWGENIFHAYMLAGVSRYVIVLHITWLINSAAHMFGTKPYDKTIRPVDTYTVSILAFGEGFHNYHHVFPWDYRTAELGRYWCNYTNIFLDFFAWLGWATDLKTVSDEMIKKRVLRTGDGSHEYSKEFSNSQGTNEILPERDVEHFWGWNDEMMTSEDRENVTIVNQTKN